MSDRALWMLLDCLTQFEAGCGAAVPVEMFLGSDMHLAGAGQLPQAQQQQDNKKPLQLSLCVVPGCWGSAPAGLSCCCERGGAIQDFRGRDVGALWLPPRLRCSSSPAESI